VKKIHFSTGLFNQIGGTTYLSRPAYFQNNDFSSSSSLEPNVEVVLEQDIACSSSTSDNEVQSEKVISPAVSLEEPNLAGLSTDKRSLVMLGSGLNSIWEDESKSEWLLLQNICQAFGLSEDQLSFFDTDGLISEEAIFSTMEEIIDLGVEWILSMDSEHPITEQLAEGVQVIDVPSLELMLFDPYAKQSFYQSVSPLITSA